jgi:hypothetical protein
MFTPPGRRGGMGGTPVLIGLPEPADMDWIRAQDEGLQGLNWIRMQGEGLGVGVKGSGVG